MVKRYVQGGVDAGDHPPITPVAAATEEDLGGGDTWRVYDYVARHFLGSISPPAVSCRCRRPTAPALRLLQVRL